MLWQRKALHNKMAKVSPVQLNNLFFLKTWGLPVTCWLVTNACQLSETQPTHIHLHTAHFSFLQAIFFSLLSRIQVKWSCTLSFLTRHSCRPLSPIAFLLDCSGWLYQLVTGDRSSDAHSLYKGKDAIKHHWNTWFLMVRDLPSPGMHLRLVEITVGWVIKSFWGAHMVKFMWLSSSA